LGSGDLLGRAGEAFTAGMTPTFLAGGALALLAAALVWWLIPRALKPTADAH
jgi:DHA2 family multidrug resistance protein-like MFS transporter